MKNKDTAKLVSLYESISTPGSGTFFFSIKHIGPRGTEMVVGSDRAIYDSIEQSDSETVKMAPPYKGVTVTSEIDPPNYLAVMSGYGPEVQVRNLVSMLSADYNLYVDERGKISRDG